MTGEMQSPDALISVIVPVYKAEQTLDRCVGSIVSQTYRNLEIILVDDGSPDDCPAMCDTWSVKDARIKDRSSEEWWSDESTEYGFGMCHW